MNFYDKFVKLCGAKATYPATACREMGLSPSATIRWKKDTIPNRSTLFRMAKYFGYDSDDFLKYAYTDMPLSEVKRIEDDNQSNINISGNSIKVNHVTGVAPISEILMALNDPVVSTYVKILDRCTPEQKQFLQDVIKELCDAQDHRSNS